MNEEEKEDIELDIEAKYVDKTEKEFLSRVTYAECLYILTPKNKYCDKIRELSVLKLCEIIEKLQNYVKENYIPIQKIKDKIEYLDNQQKQWLEDRELKVSDGEIIFARDILKELLGKE